MEVLYNWLFHFNPHTDKWEAATRDNYTQIFSGGPDVIRSSSIDTLKEIILKTEGVPSKLKVNEVY